MSSGEFLTRSTSWISIVAYAAGCVLFAAVRGRDLKWARLAWTIGCAALLTHFICAFQFYHAWSQTSAYIATARQTADVTGINWGGGLFINYAVATLWTADITWWWFAGVSSYRHRPWVLTLMWHSFLIFIIFNATVVFKGGLTRWCGIVVCSSLCLTEASPLIIQDIRRKVLRSFPYSILYSIKPDRIRILAVAKSKA